MAMTLRLSDAEMKALRETAEREHKSMQEVAKQAIAEYTTRRTRRRDELLDRIVVERADVIRRLGDA
ncbi:MAG: ribbon-helix-helix protein, CopG family [Nocardioidaceae bacterium]